MGPVISGRWVTLGSGVVFVPTRGIRGRGRSRWGIVWGYGGGGLGFLFAVEVDVELGVVDLDGLRRGGL